MLDEHVTTLVLGTLTGKLEPLECGCCFRMHESLITTGAASALLFLEEHPPITYSASDGFSGDPYAWVQDVPSPCGQLWYKLVRLEHVWGL